MGASERRAEIIKILCNRKHETISNLAEEFGVSERTILRDIELLSVDMPIYTRRGKYGGVYISDNYVMNRIYMSEKELAVLNKTVSMSEIKTICDLDESENELLRTIISQYTKPNLRKEDV